MKFLLLQIIILYIKNNKQNNKPTKGKNALAQRGTCKRLPPAGIYPRAPPPVTLTQPATSALASTTLVKGTLTDSRLVHLLVTSSASFCVKSKVIRAERTSLEAEDADVPNTWVRSLLSSRERAVKSTSWNESPLIFYLCIPVISPASQKAPCRHHYLWNFHLAQAPPPRQSLLGHSVQGIPFSELPQNPFWVYLMASVRYQFVLCLLPSSQTEVF